MKSRPLRPNAVAAARDVLTRFDVRTPRDIDVESIAMRLGIMVLYGPLTTSRATLVRAGARAIVRVAEECRGEPRGDFTVAHETGHFYMHDAIDHFIQCETAEEARARGAVKPKRGPGEHRIEEEANHFSTELRMPEPFAAPLCASPRPTLDDVVRLTSIFPTSLMSAGLRYVQLSPAPCAWVLTVGGVVQWASESATFPGKVVRGHAVDRRSLAAKRTGRRAGGSDAPSEVPGEAWGGEGTFLEHAVGMGPTFGVLSWIVPAL